MLDCAVGMSDMSVVRASHVYAASMECQQMSRNASRDLGQMRGARLYTEYLEEVGDVSPAFGAAEREDALLLLLGSQLALARHPHCISHQQRVRVGHTLVCVRPVQP